jgi:kindlin 2
MDLRSGNVIQAWPLSTIKQWRVNWETKLVYLNFGAQQQQQRQETVGDSENDGSTTLVFSCLSAPCSVLNEFIGGYIFLSARAGDRNQSLNEDLFYKLTGRT